VFSPHDHSSTCNRNSSLSITRWKKQNEIKKPLRSYDTRLAINILHQEHYRLWFTLHETSSVSFYSLYTYRRSQEWPRGHTPHIFRKYSHFVL